MSDNVAVTALFDILQYIAISVVLVD